MRVSTEKAIADAAEANTQAIKRLAEQITAMMGAAAKTPQQADSDSSVTRDKRGRPVSTDEQKKRASSGTRSPRGHNRTDADDGANASTPS